MKEEVQKYILEVLRLVYIEFPTRCKHYFNIYNGRLTLWIRIDEIDVSQSIIFDENYEDITPSEVVKELTNSINLHYFNVGGKCEIKCNTVQILEFDIIKSIKNFYKQVINIESNLPEFNPITLYVNLDNLDYFDPKLNEPTLDFNITINDIMYSITGRIVMFSNNKVEIYPYNIKIID